MKLSRILLAAAAFAVAAWADAPENQTPAKSPKVHPAYEHRGFFFSMGLGVAYQGTDVTERERGSGGFGGNYDDEGNYIPVDKYYREEKTETSVGGFTFPSLQLRFGKSIGNMVALYTVFDIDVYKTEAEYSVENSYKHFVYENGTDMKMDKDSLISAKEGDCNARGAFLAGGLGFSVYPFRDHNSPLNGLYAGFAGGAMFTVVNYKTDLHELDLAGIYTRYEIGKDWWVGDTWSLGIAFSYTTNVSFFEEDYDGNTNRFQFLIKLTRG